MVFLSNRMGPFSVMISPQFSNTLISINRSLGGYEVIIMSKIRKSPWVWFCLLPLGLPLCRTLFPRCSLSRASYTSWNTPSLSLSRFLDWCDLVTLGLPPIVSLESCPCDATNMDSGFWHHVIPETYHKAGHLRRIVHLLSSLWLVRGWKIFKSNKLDFCFINL